MPMGALQCLFSAGGWEQLWLRGVTKECSQKEGVVEGAARGEEATLTHIIFVIAKNKCI